MNRIARSCGIVIIVTAIAGCSPQVTILVPDMMCEESCAATVHELLSKQPGVKRVVVNFPAKTATVSIDTDDDAGKFDAEAAVAVLVDRGFDHSTLKSGAGEAEKADL